MKGKASLKGLLFKSEFRQLAGAKWGNVFFLLGIYFFSLFFIGSSKGVMSYLEEKMDDPFVSIVTSEVNTSFCSQSAMESYFDHAESLKKKYDISAVDFYQVDFENFSDSKTSEKNEVLKIGVLDDANHAIWQMIESKPDVFLTNPKNNLLFDGVYNQSILMTEESANRLGVLGKSSLFWRYSSGSSSARVELPISAILKVIPGELDLIMSKDLYEYLQSGGDDPSYSEVTIVSEEAWNGGMDTSLFSIVKPAPVCTGGYIVNGTSMKAIDAMKTMPILRLLSIQGAGTSMDQNGVCFQFDDLKKVRPFSTFLKEERDKYSCSNPKGALEIDLNTIESKENLELFNKFGVFLAFALGLVSIILIVNYSMALLRLHIAKNKKNLGTLTAFGFKNSKVTGLYLYISAMLLLLTFSVAYVLSFFIGNFILNSAIELTGTTIESGALEYSSLNLLVAIALFIVLPLILIYIQIIRLLQISPGDLVYERNN